MVLIIKLVALKKLCPRLYFAFAFYVFGSPLFDKVSMHVGNNKTFTIEALHNSTENIYIQEAEWNGKPYDKTYIMYDDIMQGGVLKFTMGNKPNEKFGADAASRPRSVYH